MAAEEVIAFGRFFYGYRPTGQIDASGLPVQEQVLMIRKAVPPLTQIDAVATEQDFEDYAGPYKLFQKEQKGFDTADRQDGYPLALWPAINEADMRACFHHEIYTVEQLAAHRAPLPPSVDQARSRAKRMVELGKQKGRYEAVISELEGQIGALREANNELLARVQGLQTQLGISQDLARARS